MRLIKGEFLKLFSKRVFVVCLAAVLALNVLFLVIFSGSDPQAQAVAQNTSEYETLLAECKSSDNPTDYISEKENEIQAAYQNSENLTEASRSENEARLNMLNNISSQLEYASGYDEFIGEMEQRAESQKSFSIFAEQGSYSYNNIEKTPQDFESLKGTTLEIGNNIALETATLFTLTDYLMLVLPVLAAVFLFGMERDKGLYPLVRSARLGRLPTAAAKLTVIAVVTAASCIILYSSSFITAGVIYGFGDLSRAVQSSSVFMNCSLNLSMLQYIILWILSKTLLFCSFALMVSFAFAAIKTAAKVYAVLGVFLVFEFSMFLFVDGTTVLGFLKYVNLAYIMSGNNAFGMYQNVNFFGQPVNIITVFVVGSILFCAVGAVGTCLSFTKSNQFASKSALLSKLSGVIMRKKKIRGSVNVLSGEAYKHYKTSFAAVVLLLLAILGVVNLTDDLSITFRGAAESAYNDYMQTLEGELDDEKYAYIAEQQQYFDDLRTQLEQIKADSALSEQEIEAKSLSIQTILDSRGAGFDLVTEQLSYAESKAEELGKTPALLNELSLKLLTEDTYREWQYFTLLMAAVIFCTANIFACEYKRSMTNLIRATKKGKIKLFFTKYFLVIFTATLSFPLIYLPYFVNYSNTFGTSSFSVPLAFSQNYAALTSGISVSGYIIVLAVTHYFAMLAAVTLVFALSLLLKSNAMAMIVSSGILLVPCLATIRVTSVRMNAMFKNDVWQTAVVCIILLCIILIAVLFLITLKKYTNIGRKHYAQA